MSFPLIFSLFFILPLVLTETSCKKELNTEISNSDLNSSKSRLNFTKSDFDKLYLKLRNTDNKQQLKEFVDVKSTKPDFISLSVSDLDTKISKTAEKLVDKKLLLNGSSSINNSGLSGNGKISFYGNESSTGFTTPTYDEVVKEVVDDDAFATLLNEDGEIQVEYA